MLSLKKCKILIYSKIWLKSFSQQNMYKNIKIYNFKFVKIPFTSILFWYFGHTLLTEIWNHWIKPNLRFSYQKTKIAASDLILSGRNMTHSISERSSLIRSSLYFIWELICDLNECYYLLGILKKTEHIW